MLENLRQIATDMLVITREAVRRYFEPLHGVFETHRSYYLEKELSLESRRQDLKFVREQRDMIRASPPYGGPGEDSYPTVETERDPYRHLYRPGEAESIVVLRPELPDELRKARRRREASLAAQINHALAEEGFELFRQVIVPSRGYSPDIMFEIIPQMRIVTGASVPPEYFTPTAERYGLAPRIDRWVFSRVLRWLADNAFERQRLAFCSINISGQSLADKGFLEFVVEQFRQTGLKGSCVCFEIAEADAVANFSQVTRFVDALKQLDCRFAIDDFGTGMSSFGYLKRFAVDFLKIDQSFVREMAHDPIDREMVRSINEIAHLVDKKTIAFGVEDANAVQMLREFGVDYVQGAALGAFKPIADPIRAFGSSDLRLSSA